MLLGGAVTRNRFRRELVHLDALIAGVDHDGLVRWKTQWIDPASASPSASACDFVAILQGTELAQAELLKPRVMAY